MLHETYIDDLKISYQDFGSGKTVFLLHGFGEDANIWKHQVEFLKNNYRLIIPHLPGTASSLYINKESVTIDDYADVIYHLYKHLNLPGDEKIIMLGHSMGGYITLAFANKYSSCLLAFGLIHSTAFADNDEKKKVRLKAIETIEKYGADAFLKITIPTLFSDISRQNISKEINELVSKADDFSAKSLQQYYRAMMLRKDRTDVLKNATVPVLFVTGEEDKAAPMNDVLQQVHLPEISSVKILKNVAHMGMIEAKDEMNETIATFLHSIF